VKNTVGKLLEGCRSPKDASKLRILDPACGSGSFLIVAYQTLLDWHLDWYTKNGPEELAKKSATPVYQAQHLDPDGAPRWLLTTAEKKRILLNGIYGVDIDAQAVEVTKLSLMLKVLEGETGQTINSQMKLFHERALPDLSSNIKCGNSLIGPDFYDGQQLGILDQEEMYRVNVFDWKRAYPAIMEAGGFDAVIGNPPYVRIQRISQEESNYFFSVYETPTSKTDLSQLFLEKALCLVNGNGLVSFICTSQWLSTDYGRNLRAKLGEGLLHSLVDFGSLPVFEKADTYPAIVVLSRSRAESMALTRVTERTQLSLDGIEAVSSRQVPFTSLGSRSWNLNSLDLIALLGRAKRECIELRALGNAYIGVLTGMDEAFVTDADEVKMKGLELKLLYPYAYRGAEVSRYGEVRPHSLVIYPYSPTEDGRPQLIPESVLSREYPAIHEHLQSFKPRLQVRKDSRRFYANGIEWYRQLRPGSFSYIEPRKLLVKGIDTHLCVGLLGENTAFNGANCPGIILNHDDPSLSLLLLGILNSRLISHYLRALCPAKLGGYTRFNATNISSVPLPRVFPALKKEREEFLAIAARAEAMVGLQKMRAKARTPYEQTLIDQEAVVLEKQIDELVYKLYGLTDAEVEIVEHFE